MRKQTKLVAVLSAAALLAIGASMTSFAAWQKSDDGTWQYFDKDGEMITGEWQKDGTKWFYLDDDGNMLTDSWVDDEYYVREDGSMIVNDWKKTLSDDDVDDPDDDGEAWYYFGSKGKKTQDTDKKIGGKVYYFGDNGKMLDGWHTDKTDLYYLGGEDDGARKSGWLWLEMPGEDEDAAPGHTEDCEDCDEEGWYYFGTDGKMYLDASKKKVNGKYYFFNAHGQMLYEWINGSMVDAATPVNAIKDSDVNASPANAKDMFYVNSVEEGWRADGWQQIDGSQNTGSENDTDWYYFKDGKAKKADMTKTDADSELVTWSKDLEYRAKIKVEGKNFCFDEIGRMQTGLQFIPAEEGFYYFDASGYMKTGKVSNVEEDNDSFTYYFETKNGKLGKGVTGEKSGYLYWNGKRLEADDDYRIYKVNNAEEYYLVNKSGKLQKGDSKEYTIENSNGIDKVKFTFNGYKITSAKEIVGKDTEVAYDYTSDPTIPKIELYDRTHKLSKPTTN